MIEQVLRLYKETYYDLNIRRPRNCATSTESVGYTWVQKALQGAGLVANSWLGRKATGG